MKEKKEPVANGNNFQLTATQFNEVETAVIPPQTTNHNKFQSLFEATPISLWEEDFSDVKKFIDQLIEDGVEDFRAYFDMHPEDVFHCIQLVKVIDVNQQTLTMYRAKSKDELLQNLEKIFGPEAFDIFKEELILIGQGDTLFESEGINYTIDGEPINVAIRWSVVPGFEETLSHVIVSSIDITQLKRSSEQLRLHATALESAANAIVISDDSGNILWVNPAFTNLTGYSYNEVLGKNPRILKSGKNSDVFYEELWSTIKAGDVWHGEELINRRKDGTLYHEKMTIAPVKDENGRISRFIAIKEDISERKQLEMKLRRQLKEEEILREVMSLTNANEEFSTIITAICEKLAHFFDVSACVFALLDDESMFAEVVAEYFDPAYQESVNLISLINILPLDLIMAQKETLTIENVQEAAIFEPVRDILANFDNKSSCLVPILIGDKIKGILEFAAFETKACDHENIEFVEQIAFHISQNLQRVQTEKELNKQRDFAQQVMTNMGQGLVVIDTNWFIEYCNPAFAQMLGYQQEKLIGKSALDLVFKIDPKLVKQVYSRWLGGEVQNRELPLERADGLPVHVLMTAVPRIVDSEVNGAIAVITDMTERRKMDIQLQRERDFAHQIMNNMGQGLLVLTKERTIRYCNPTFVEMVGYDHDELLEKPMFLLLNNEAVYDSIQPDQTELQSGKLIREVTLKHANGEDVHVLLTAVPPKDDIETNGAIVVVTDLSKQKEIEQALSDARDQAIEASRLKSEFLANMSHEIRTPLNAVIGMTSLMLDSQLTAEQQEFAETIRNSGDVLLSLINDILDFSKIEAGKLELEERPFTIRDCVEEALDVVVTKASEKGLELAYIIDDQVPHDIMGDVTRVRQILVNLLNNAIKFTETGEVVLSVQCNQPKYEMQNKKLLQFSVKDTGIGIPDYRLNRLFKSFSQVDASTTRRFGGTGLGLAISKQLVEMMGGQIWVESIEGKGSTFHFTITSSSVPVNRHVITQKVQSELKGKRLLIVDDNETNRKILVKQAKLWGMLPTAVESGFDALQLIQADKQYDCAILDMQMPEMDGIMLAREIRKLRHEKTLPLVMLSSIGDRDEFKDNNYFAAFLTKPIKQQLLSETLNGVFSDTAVSQKRVPKKLQIDPEMGKKHPLRLLLAEDNLVNQKVASRILERMGYRADIAADGLEVLEALQRQPYDVVLMDVQMPNMDGVEATIQIRDIWPPEQQPTVVAMTAHALTGDREKYLNAGMDHYISKPVRIQELLQVLAKCQPMGRKII